MPATDNDFIFQTACLVLAAAEDCLTAAGVTLPERRFVSACEADLSCCDTLQVQPSSIRLEDDISSKPGNPCIVRRVFTFDIVIARCVTVFEADGTAPPIGDCADPQPGTITGEAQEILIDRWVLFNCLVTSVQDNAGQGEPFCCRPGRIVSVQSLCSGGCAGSRFVLELRM